MRIVKQHTSSKITLHLISGVTCPEALQVKREHRAQDFQTLGDFEIRTPVQAELESSSGTNRENSSGSERSGSQR